ncbi:MAG: SagB/ThcOx family dehydrogenase [Candidatus Riflebacteria bacterium]
MSNPIDRKKYQTNRDFLKDATRLEIDFSQTAQSLKIPAPPLQKPFPADAVLIKLPDGQKSLIDTCSKDLASCIIERESIRRFSDQPLTLEELSGLLFATQGLRKILSPSTAVRTVPSAGSRHAFETYLAITRVNSLESGLYRYLPLDHALIKLKSDNQIGKKAADACLGQTFVAKAAVTFFWTVLPERMEWRYDLAAHKVLALDAGHVGQNLYLAATAIAGGTCAIAAYNQRECDDLLGVDGEDEFTIYVSPVGKKADQGQNS